MARRTLIMLLLIGLVLSSAGSGVMASFNDSGQNAGNTFSACPAVALHPETGTDETNGGYTLSAAELAALSASDDNRYETQIGWASAYSDADYLGVTFPDMTPTLVVLKVFLTVEWQRLPQLDSARLKVFDGLGNQQIYYLGLPKQSCDGEETIDLSGFINTAEKVNGLEVWFQATSSPPKATKHDLVEVMVWYQE